MNLNIQKDSVIDYVRNADDNFINMVHLLIEEYEHKDIVGYSTGNSFTKEDIVKRVLQASERVKSGKYIEQASLEKEIANW